MDTEAIDLKDLLAKQPIRNTAIQNLRDFTDWAERKVMDGDTSENLLILASLGLDHELLREDVQTYFDAYLREIGREYPSNLEATIYYFRRSFKIMAFSTDDNVVLSTLIDTFNCWYDFYNPILSKVVEYWSGVKNDFIDCFDDDLGYLYLRYEKHSLIPHDERCNYIKEMAGRFFRLLDCRDYNALILKNCS